MRRIHFVGTLGNSNYACAAKRALELAGRYTTTLPANEPANWVIEPIKALGQRSEVLTLVKPRFHKDPMRPWHGAVYAARPGKHITAETLGLTYAQQAAESLPVLLALVAAYHTSWRMQVDIPGPFDRAAFAYGPFLSRYYRTEVLAASQQVNTIEEQIPGTVYHLSIPVETHLVASAPAPLKQPLAERFARRIAGFILHTTPGTEWIVHPCAGDPNGKPLKDPHGTKPADPATLEASVILGNAIWQEWPAGYRFNALHLPMGDGAHPAPANPWYYASLYGLDLPEEVHISAGLANLGASCARQQVALQEAERAARRQLGISTPCGLGRRAAEAEGLIHRMVDLSVAGC